jgi:cytosine/adenosine deaminase-related metal-dependent hydrolase
VSAEPWSLSARWVFPVAGPPLERGVVVVAGDRLAAVEPHGARRPDLDLGDAAVLPGLVNAHTHLDLSGMRGLAPPSPDFTGWLRQVIRHRRARSPEQVRDDIRAGLAECVRYGTTLVGDIASEGASWETVKDAPLRAVVYREMLGLPRERAHRAWADALDWLRTHPATPTCRPGLSPHAPYSVRASLFRATANLARARGLPVAIHAGESLDEFYLLAGQEGPFVEFLSELGVLDRGGLIAEVYQGLLTTFRGVEHAAFIHANYLALCAAPELIHASFRVLCPRTRAAFRFVGGPDYELAWPGIHRVALGTDSLASNPDLDLLAEARFLHRLRPDLSGETILRTATLSGAEALGWADETGSLAPGKSADLVVLPLPAGPDGGDPHRLVLGSDRPVRRVLFRGRWVYDAEGGGIDSPPVAAAP